MIVTLVVGLIVGAMAQKMLDENLKFVAKTKDVEVAGPVSAAGKNVKVPERKTGEKDR